MNSSDPTPAIGLFMDYILDCAFPAGRPPYLFRSRVTKDLIFYKNYNLRTY
jgi:hypothetical protein